MDRETRGKPRRTGASPISSESLTLGEMIREARLALKMNQTELGKIWAERVGRPRPFQQHWISTIERGHYNLRDADLAVLGEVLGVEDLGQSARMLDEDDQVRNRIPQGSGDVFGTADRMRIVSGLEVIRLDFSSGDGRRSDQVGLTKFPVGLAGAVDTALHQSGVFEYFGENFRGRVCSWEEPISDRLPFSLVAKFEHNGYLVHLTGDQIDAFRGEIMRLPLRDLKTD